MARSTTKLQMNSRLPKPEWSLHEMVKKSANIVEGVSGKKVWEPLVYKSSEAGKREMIQVEIRQEDEQSRKAMAVSMAAQGA